MWNGKESTWERYRNDESDFEWLRGRTSGSVALSGSRANLGTQRRVSRLWCGLMVDDLEDLISDLSWLDRYGNRLIEHTTDWDIVVCISCSLKTATVSIWPSVPRVYPRVGGQRSKFWSYKRWQKVCLTLTFLVRTAVDRSAYWRGIWSILQWILVGIGLCRKAIRRNQLIYDRPPLWHLSVRTSQGLS